MENYRFRKTKAYYFPPSPQKNKIKNKTKYKKKVNQK
jgi:hypothetical protein